ncbi:hypothetical protein [Trinickia dinghuensis]|uniref:Uncharacterized protein n=1 Tax=Trinickia dinghuensis TaxID=2291023 RepID=A0A3D8JQE6_9BURK|nr:hypothetical protein [Trinickia dinghuensis]RDU95248.1 hypothetical protein DWV00_30145 [Trinickia dinghuensis]
MYNAAAQFAAVTVASDLIEVFKEVYGDTRIEELQSLDKALREIAERAEREFASCDALPENRRQVLAEAIAELAIAREAADDQNLIDMTNALKRAAGRINALVVDVMTNMG